jgi:hypothetical protein
MVGFGIRQAAVIPLATTTFTVLRKPEQSDGYPDAEPVYEPVVTGVRGHLEIMPRRIFAEDFERSTAMARFTCDPCDLHPFDYLRDEVTERLWRVEWCEPRPHLRALAHVAGQALDVAAEVSALIPKVHVQPLAVGASHSGGRASGTVI